MNYYSHPGGEEHTRHMLSCGNLKAGARILDMGAGAGEAVEFMKRLGYAAEGIDLFPRNEIVRKGNFLDTGYPEESFDCIFSQCAFYISGQREEALKESRRLLKPAGVLLLSDVFYEDPEKLLERNGFFLQYQEDLTKKWQEYYLELLWKEEEVCLPREKGKCRYVMLAAKKRVKEHGCNASGCFLE